MMQTTSCHRPLRLLMIALGCGLQTGCGIFSPAPLWELVKAGGAAASMVVSDAPGQATHTVQHPHPPVTQLCIEHNPDAQVADLLPSLQSELRRRRVASRIYEDGTPPSQCAIWLTYDAAFDWDTPPLVNQYRQVLTAASLTLRRSDGRVLASSQYAYNPSQPLGRWSSTERKLAPVLDAVLTPPMN
jgi:hypothetical protein